MARPGEKKRTWEIKPVEKPVPVKPEVEEPVKAPERPMVPQTPAYQRLVG